MPEIQPLKVVTLTVGHPVGRWDNLDSLNQMPLEYKEPDTKIEKAAAAVFS